MEIFNSIENYKKADRGIILTIGNFDGVHRGHQMLFKQMKEIADEDHSTVAITFQNHPSQILRPEQPVKLLCTLEHRIRLIEACGLDHLILMPFTNYFAKHSAMSFIERLRDSIVFDHLVLGFDATLGRDRQGNPHVIKELGHNWGFDVHYIEQYRFEGIPVSSSGIRQLLEKGELESVETLLSRPFSIYSKAIPSEEPDLLSVNTHGLCLPPIGEYAIKVRIDGHFLEGKGSLTDRSELKVKVVDSSFELSDQLVEVIFLNSL